MKFGKLLASFVACYAVLALGAVASISARSYYSSLVQPEWAPPGWLFGPVWTTLYTLMAISVWLVWRRNETKGVSRELIVFGAQLVFNGLWSWLFFKWNLGAAAFLDILLLLSLIIANVSMFWKHSKLAAALLIPYLTWVAFAAALCYSVWQLNPTELG
ncbi:TspO/MBR family protein [Pelagicoccus albus]|nr:TspO/MBR family protein [Pelagicoccus albus]